MFCTNVPETGFKPFALFQIDGSGRRLQLGEFESVEAAVDMLFYRPVEFFSIEADADHPDHFDGIVVRPRNTDPEVQFAIEPIKH